MTLLPLLFAVQAAAQAAPQTPQPISRAAYTSRLDQAFAQFDANGDGQITAAEIASAQSKEAAQLRTALEQRRTQVFNAMDTNHDGQISRAEFNAANQIQLPQPTPPASVIAEMDTNKDGKISKDEFRSPKLRQFDAADTNHDGMVSPAEAQAAAQAGQSR